MGFLDPGPDLDLYEFRRPTHWERRWLRFHKCYSCKKKLSKYSLGVVIGELRGREGKLLNKKLYWCNKDQARCNARWERRKREMAQEESDELNNYIKAIDMGDDE